MKKLLLISLISLLFGGCSLLGLNNPQNKEQTSVKTITSTENPQDAIIREHCKMMPEMQGCEKYNNSTIPNNFTDVNKKSLNELILVDDETTTDAKPAEVVNLKDGDTYNLTVQKVRKVINGKTLGLPQLSVNFSE